ncbi:MAG: chemotaxis protein CheA [Sedimentisphaerales bacterium]|nr:chemotaxis protein CheA [Sedimentisphaerales bacterium]
MSNNKAMLKDLIEQAASQVMLLDAEQTCDMEQFNALFQQIVSAAGNLDQGPEPIIARFQSLGQDAAQAISAALTQQNQGQSDCVEKLSSMVSDLQTLLAEIDCTSGQTFPQAAAAPSLTEEDLPLIMDFINESREHLENAESALLEIEHHPEEEEILNGIFRAFHTVKGTAGFLNLTDINKLAHSAENLLDMARKGQLKLVGDASDAALASVDMLKGMLASLEAAAAQTGKYQSPAELDAMISTLETLASAQPKPAAPASAPAPQISSQAETVPAVESAATTITFTEEDLPLIIDFINESKEHIENAEAALLELENNPEDAETLNKIFRSFHTIKGMAGFLNLTDTNKLAHAAENLLDMARKGQLKLTGPFSDATFASIDMLKTMLTAMETASGQNTAYQTPGNVDALIARLHDCASGKITEADPKASTPEQAPEPLKETEDHKLDTMLSGEKEHPAVTASKTAEEKIKVSTTRLDDLINMTGELAVAQLMIAEEVGKSCNNDSDLYRKVAHQNKIVRQLQELSMSMRMVTVQGVFQKMARLVRDLSRKAGKTIDFVTSGEDTELDRTIVDKITDPLIHMMRNSVDHGIESAEDRKAKGKPGTGHVNLRAYHQAGTIIIEITDDGRGLNRDKILKKATEKGLVTKGQDVSDDEIYKMIFMAGFSTADKITDVSGRGVGMDVVRKNIESIGGKIDIRTKIDQGTTFLIRLPLTLAIIDGQIVTLGSQRYIIPINSVVHSIRPTVEQISSVQNRAQMVKIRDMLMPLVPLHKLFNAPDARQNPTDGLLVVVEEGNHKCCLQVDDLLGQQQVVIKSISGLGNIKGVSGGAVMGDGRVSLILDIPGLIALAQTQTY